MCGDPSWQVLIAVKKQLLSIALLLTLLLPIAGTLGWMGLQKWQVKREVKQRMLAGIDRGQLVQIRLSLAEANTLLEWEHDAEFRYQGEMYDVVDSYREGNHIIYWCWPDREETRLYRELEDLTARALRNDPLRDKSRGQVISFMKTLFFESQPATHFYAPVTARAISQVPYSLCTGISPMPPTPPPDPGKTYFAVIA
ncbi:hypothetical protein [Robiginitalea marina]|uniref:Uncharacterized protein n=1 Tax=Robiginitalea marina TaxID=2954105 RepID=A0ABT1B0Y9_9FLAO|nr:hypothetical protein [Robiginitalea marina]MCO5725639.1 hypothetical protein [Robiginitalea marina]